MQGPLIIAANHPNSFLDAIIIDLKFKHTVHALTRGDVFKNKFVAKFLSRLHMLPVYRVSEGSENLGINYQTFAQCRDILKNNGIVLVFIEGQCENEWKLRKFKKGTARLALGAWEEGIPVKILPLALNYSSFQTFGKNLEMNFGDLVSSDMVKGETEGLRLNEFNTILKNKLEPLVMEIPKNDKALIRQKFFHPVPQAKKILLALPAWLGYLIHAPVYLPVKAIAGKYCRHNVHYDSVTVALLFALYPLYLLLLSLILFFLSGSYWAFLVIPVFPLLAKAYVELKNEPGL